VTSGRISLTKTRSGAREMLKIKRGKGKAKTKTKKIEAENYEFNRFERAA
jgi:hypothetical protein